MKKALLILILACFLLTGYCCNALAIRYDYGDAPGYAQASHSNPSWQRLGTKWNREKHQKNEDKSDDGVSWSVDNGATWGHEDVFSGQAVQFKFDMYKRLWGNHSFDLLKVWIDWDQNRVFDESDDSEEMVLADAWYFTEESGYKKGDGYAGISKSFYLDLTVPDDALIGTTWLRAGVVCNFDSPTLAGFSATGHYYQGEVEDWKLTINPVPEPGTILLVGCGLVGLFYLRRIGKK